MRIMLTATAAAAALCAASFPAAANPQPSDQAVQPSQQRTRAGNDERMVCIIDRRSETRIPRRICRTAREWREENDDQR